ncbi:MAG: NAD(P)/FAD-dependent oxidoreductase [Parvularculaceae bacterium]|nr:NAD(P)/FAD-dependent oxidoreductase [Parvularculaceae bacterium]
MDANAGRASPHLSSVAAHDVVIVGGGAGGIAAAASLLKRRRGLKIAVVEPRERHFYQPGWTMVGAGIFSFEETGRATKAVIPNGVEWIRQEVAAFSPETSEIKLRDGRRLPYRFLVAAPGIKLDWARVEGLEATLGKNGVTSNYREGVAPYTFELVRNLKSGTAIFAQPPMPIKCAGAPQKAMYLSADYWLRQQVLDKIEIHFCNAGAVLFGVAAYVPALMEYVKKYRAQLNFGENLVAVDGPARTAFFDKTSSDGASTRIVRKFDILHVCPPQATPDVVRKSALVNEAGWIDVDPQTMRHKKFPNVFALGDAASTANAKTAAAVRKQAPVVAANLLSAMDGAPLPSKYEGYGSCPLTVERGKIVLAEFGYDGKLQPTFPAWVNDGLKPTAQAWLLKERILPMVYWRLMLKGREWLAVPV